MWGICGENVDFSQQIPHIFSVQQWITSTVQCGWNLPDVPLVTPMPNQTSFGNEENERLSLMSARARVLALWRD